MKYLVFDKYPGCEIIYNLHISIVPFFVLILTQINRFCLLYEKKQVDAFWNLYDVIDLLITLLES